MTLVEWLLVALVAVAMLSLTLLYLSYVYLIQINDAVAKFVRMYGDQPIHATEFNQNQALRHLEYLETAVRNWRDGR